MALARPAEKTLEPSYSFWTRTVLYFLLMYINTVAAWSWFWEVYQASALRGRSLTPLSQTPIGSNYKDWSAELGEPVVFRPELL